MRQLFESQLDVTAKVMDLRLQRQNIVTGNIANVNTPGYKARRLEFEEKMQDALNQNALGKMTRTAPSHLPSTFDPTGFAGEGLQDFKAREIYGQDSVNLDKEMATNAKNTMMYNALASVIKKSFDGMNKVIQEGSK
ncbi:MULTISPECIES: flagellar basal body rod protein FlgB [unclassified Pseudodesulfovibrio]|uniref:flagellar basal body rod protein FlgB n=1 Tax=unclassified Pseudodesulfovibrio TaxID=2661612 RepID=UPI000FEB733F|nr:MULTISPECIES: flagellar basal body rod protein FlgB [unclassified Pseudodesulfovibrio]MCJ2165916.1 flagellar basal body rod protein FlgB [Pseudodesulfovibrio sp. S3-i]RWU02653.1 flagellar basal body rod protein FlgB [Pseudodesulfovibrio sp. S3]